MRKTHTFDVIFTPLRRRRIDRALARRAFRRRSRWLLGMLRERRERLLLVYERVLNRSVRVETRLAAVARQLAAVDRAVRGLQEPD